MDTPAIGEGGTQMDAEKRDGETCGKIIREEENPQKVANKDEERKRNGLINVSVTF